MAEKCPSVQMHAHLLIQSNSWGPHGLYPTRLFCPWDFQQEYWSGLPFPSPGGFPDAGIKPMSPASPALPGGFFTTETPGNPLLQCTDIF